MNSCLARLYILTDHAPQLATPTTDVRNSIPVAVIEAKIHIFDQLDARSTAEMTTETMPHGQRGSLYATLSDANDYVTTDIIERLSVTEARY